MAVETKRMKIAFIGSHGVGKTTLAYGLAARLKARDVSLEMVHEVARRCPLPINEETGVASESWILHTQIAEESIAHARYPVVICDRSALDNYVYLLLVDGPQKGLDGLVDHWMASYDLLVLVPIIQSPSPDGLRATDPAFQRAIEDRLRREMRLRGLVSVQLQVDRRQFWLDDVEKLVWNQIKPSQLQLL